MSKTIKGYCSVKPYRCRGWHKVDPAKRTIAKCGRAKIAITEEGVAELPPKVRRAFKRLQRCDYCDVIK